MIVLPEDTNGATEKLDELLVDPAASVYLFIFGNSPQLQAFATAADAARDGALRAVVRRSRYDDIFARFSALRIDSGVPPISAPNVVGFSTSGHLIVSDVILSSDNLNRVRAVRAYMAAEAHG